MIINCFVSLASEAAGLMGAISFAPQSATQIWFGDTAISVADTKNDKERITNPKTTNQPYSIEYGRHTKLNRPLQDLQIRKTNRKRHSLLKSRNGTDRGCGFDD